MRASTRFRSTGSSARSWTRSSGSSATDRVQHAGERIRIDGLEQVRVEAGISGPLHVVRLTVSGQRDQVGTRRPERAHAARDLVAVHLGQADVDQRDLGMILAGELERAWPGAGGVDTMAFELEERAQRFTGVLVVFDDEDGAPG